MMNYAIDRARETMNLNYGGPFGACIVKDGEIISVSSNTVLRDNDATAHAEVNAIREASRKLQTYDLSGCVIYTTGYPCPMCLSAIMWANIDEIYYGADLEDASKIGFRDDFIYQYIKNDFKGDKLKMVQVSRDKCVKLFDEYAKNQKKIY